MRLKTEVAAGCWPPNSPPNSLSSRKPILKVDSAIEGESGVGESASKLQMLLTPLIGGCKPRYGMG